jgi:hypothetical protein
VTPGIRGTWRTATSFHEHPSLVALAQTPTGRVVVWVTTAALLRPYDNAVFIIPVIALVSLWPERRALLLSLGAVAFAIGYLLEQQGVSLRTPGPAAVVPTLVTLLLLVGLLYLCFRCARDWSRLPDAVRRRPQVWLHALMWAGIVAAWTVPAERGLAGAIVVLAAGTLPFLVWRCGYVLMAGQRGKASATRFRDHFFYLFPVYGGTNVPFGKGFNYLAAHESRSREAFARAQLAGLKLLVLAALWRVAILVLDGVVTGDRGGPVTRLLGGQSLGLPRLATLIAGGDAVSASIAAAWLAVYVELIRRTLNVAVLGHVIIGGLRLCGFNVFRNTYKPLLAESVVEFWNRYYYYFKELLVEFFFFPTYLRYFRTRPLLRMFTATFAAAFAGNLYYTLLREPGPVVAADFGWMWQELAPRILYCFLLAAGIWVSMARQQRRRGAATAGRSGWERLGGIAGVWTFYSIIHIWNIQAEGVTLTFAGRTRFFLALFGL